MLMRIGFNDQLLQIEASGTYESLVENEKAYVQEAQRLRQKYEAQINILIGFECDWIRPSSLTLIKDSLDRYPFDYFVGSVHHVHTIPIDFDTPMYVQARDAAGGTDDKLFEDYFDAQFEMLKALKPPVIGHFDLIRLKSDDPERSFKQWPAVWEKILRNLDFAAEYGGIMELNSASLRKGMSEPYPKAEICRVSPKFFTGQRHFSYHCLLTLANSLLVSLFLGIPDKKRTILSVR
jgi:histidinol-phosphatase (PHP family)